MKIKYCTQDGYITMKSNCLKNEMDMLSLLASDISDKDTFNRFYKNILMDSKSWCSNLTESKVIDKRVLISTAFSLDDGHIPSCLIEKTTLKNILHDWKDFMKHKQTFTRDYH